MDLSEVDVIRHAPGDGMIISLGQVDMGSKRKLCLTDITSHCSLSVVGSGKYTYPASANVIVNTSFFDSKSGRSASKLNGRVLASR